MSSEDLEKRLKGLKKYPRKIEDLDLIDKQYFPFPRHAVDLKLTNKDLSILLAVCYHINIFEGKKAFVFEESIDRIMISLRKSNIKKVEFFESINRLRETNLIEVDGNVMDTFDVTINMPNGYATVTYGEFKKLISIDGRQSWIVHAVFLTINCSLFISEKKQSSYIFYKRQEHISGKLAISTKTCGRAISKLEEVGVLAVYNVRLMDSVKQKSVLSRHIYRDKLRIWMSKELQKPYGAIYRIINETGEEEENDND